MKRVLVLTLLGALVTAVIAALVLAGAAPIHAKTGGPAIYPVPEKPQATPPAAPGTVSRLDQFWLRALMETYKTPAELAAQRERDFRRGPHYDVLYQGDRKVRAVALTFDDGPHPLFTAKILAILRNYKIKATFFVVGEMAEQHPLLIREEAAAGHVIGNHTYHHVNLTKIPVAEIPTEWQACQDVVKSITGQTMRFCRPPGGDYDGAVMAAATSLGLTTVLWTDDPSDYASPGANTIEARVLRRIGNGGIILIHDGIQQTIDILPQMIETLQKRGFRFVTVEEMGGLRNAGPARDLSPRPAAAPRPLSPATH